MTVLTTTTTTCGALRGVIDRGIATFRGIPYARPPVGALRFTSPQPPESWTCVRDASTFGPAAVQAASPVYGRQVVAETSEDCLFLNVWTPAIDDGHRPVLVWLHGGAFSVGAGSRPLHDGAALARRGDVVVVTLNYRLGLFGYLRGIDVCGDALPSTGNEGLLDQLAALRWVRAEIAAFGGDPENVTVFGQSAGAVSISAMLSMPQSRGLFRKAIMQSGVALRLRPPAANQVMEAILGDLDLAPHEAGGLRELPAAQLLEVQSRVTPRTRGVAYGPVADGVDLPSDPLAAIGAGSAAGVPLLIGTNLEEQKFFRRLDPQVDQLTQDALLERLASIGDDAHCDPAEVVALYRQARAARAEGTTPPELWVAIMSDRRFRGPMMRVAELHAAHTPQTYAYLFTWQSPGWNNTLGAAHTLEVPFVFGTLDAARELVPAESQAEALSAQMQDAWIAFARTGSPRTSALPDWEPYSIPRRSTMLLGTSSRAVDAPYEPERRVWASPAGTTAPRHASVS
jgi:para-nitrobenzyl esterase